MVYQERRQIDPDNRARFGGLGVGALLRVADFENVIALIFVVRSICRRVQVDWLLFRRSLSGRTILDRSRIIIKPKSAYYTLFHRTCGHATRSVDSLPFLVVKLIVIRRIC